ncbi:GntR family transcriptional regulator [Alicyclobacillus contaminans]|uniref:GntR family transcriptional regulator n=1 Tax=Alicyclobacillus contaminans TaxID=392016 RepID=UPI00042032F0|nr:GntR family transcriptional regulator [Alicyclobacillus contaminans]GMA49862.1 GntR family transcriptional regulator [Alicyclobacillus contaminans]
MKTSVPLYQHLKAEILREIQAGRWRPGEQIPSEAELAQEMGVSRITVRQAVGDLVSLGYLTRRQGKGTFLVDQRHSVAASKLHGFAEELRARGYQVDIEVKGLRTMTCPQTVAESLRIAPSAQVIQIRRVATVGDSPIFRETSYLVPPPQATLAVLAEHGDTYNHVYGFFEQHGVKISFGTQQVSATRAVYEDMQELNVRSDEPILMIRRVTCDQTGTPVEFSEVRYPSSRYQFEVKLTRE